MTGMKEGAGDDPFAEDADSSDDGHADEEPDSAVTGGGGAVVEQERTESESSASASRPSIPWKFRRDGVQDGRDRVPLFLQPETKRTEREFKASVEGALDEDVSLTDLREAAYLVAMEHQHEVVAQLREWGYDYEAD